MGGWRTSKKIIVFESDDWGTIRMPSLSVLNNLKKASIPINNCHYVRNDSLASPEDLFKLSQMLLSHQNGRGENPIITLNTIVANPDFKKIKDSGFTKYYCERFTKTLENYPDCERSFEYWMEGIDKKVFFPQYHAREHLQVSRWMRSLQDEQSEARRLFEDKFFGLSASLSQEDRRSFMAAYDWEDEADKSIVLESIGDGLKIFEEIFGYKSLSTIPPNYTWDSEIEQKFNKHGVRFLQGGNYQRLPTGSAHPKIKRRKIGDANSFNQYYLFRNCRFEPSSNLNIDWVNRCLEEISTAFIWKKPAVIDTHRVNYIGRIFKQNRDHNLELLDQLLSVIIEKWPDVHFMTSSELGLEIENGRS